MGFGARKLLPDDEDKGPKYLNTPETPIYRKSSVLYGLDLARRAIATGKQVVIVEGYTDVMACHLAGVTTAIATCGTALTVDHIKVIRRVLGDSADADTGDRGEVVFTFDPDEAGQRAASRAFAEEQRFAAQTFVAVAPDGLDPCDLRLHRGDDAVRSLIRTRRPMFEFMIRRRLAGHDLETVEGRTAALRASAPIVAGIRDRSLSGGYVRSLAMWLGLDPAEVSRAVTAASRATPRVEERRPQGDASRSSASSEPVAPRTGLVDLPTDPATRGERDALMAMLQYPDSVGEELLRRAAEVRFGNESLRVVRDAVVASLPADATWVDRVVEQVPEGFVPLARDLAAAPIPTQPDRLAAYCESVVSDLVVRDLLRRRGELVGAMQRAQAEGDQARWAALSRQSAELETERRRLRRE
ncbi:hypothetical protein GCM10025881_04130 [Pseudolysinimonas kribbensis]|uniref:Toprim domain-containing protein n=1 Tax=Pseudolysinimonas kribbensis TaxID=433641 RepID=A0ABQ6K2M3_9MICO|nr:hypothetical protein GCM10025881_04130 [Pseudolysinimonas kribbensis]